MILIYIWKFPTPYNIDPHWHMIPPFLDVFQFHEHAGEEYTAIFWRFVADCSLGLCRSYEYCIPLDGLLLLSFLGYMCLRQQMDPKSLQYIHELFMAHLRMARYWRFKTFWQNMDIFSQKSCVYNQYELLTCTKSVYRVLFGLSTLGMSSVIDLYLKVLRWWQVVLIDYFAYIQYLVSYWILKFHTMIEFISNVYTCSDSLFLDLILVRAYIFVSWRDRWCQRIHERVSVQNIWTNAYSNMFEKILLRGCEIQILTTRIEPIIDMEYPGNIVKFVTFRNSKQSLPFDSHFHREPSICDISIGVVRTCRWQCTDVRGI